MSEPVNPSESPIPGTRPNQEILIDDIVGNKSLKMKLSWDFLEKLLEEGKLEKQSSGCFQAAEGVLKEMEKQGILDDLEHLDAAVSIDTSDVAPHSQNTPVPVFKRKRGRPRKETGVPHSLESELSSIPSNSKVLNFCSRRSSKRKSKALKIDESTDGEYPCGFEQTIFRGKSKRRRQPKVLDDYVTDFDTSDEEMETFSHRSPTFQFSKQRRGRGRSKRPHALHSFESDDILSYYLGDFDKKFSEQDLFPDKFFEETHDSKDDEDVPNIMDTKSTVGAAVSDRKDPLTAGLEIDNISNNVALDLDDNTRSTRKNRGSNNSSRTPHHQLAALQQRYCQLLQKLQKKPPVNKVVDLVHGASKLLNEEQLVFFTLQLKSSSTNLQGVRFSAREKVLALAIYAHNPETYKWLQSIFYLPTKLILDRWLEAMAKNNPETVKKLIYYIYNKYIFNS